MKTEDLEGKSFGCVVTGLRESDLDNASLRECLRQLWIERGLLIFRDGDSHPAFHVGLSRVFGELQVHSVREILVGGQEELIQLVSDPTAGSIME